MIDSLRNKWFEIFVISAVIFLGGVLSLRFVPGLSASVYSFISPSQVAAGEPIVVKSHREFLTEKYNLASSTPQFVLLSFDGSKSLEMLDETRNFVKDMISQDKPLNFTYFISMAYFMTEINAKMYNPPNRLAGSSAIGYSNSEGDVLPRLNKFREAQREGNEIGSHAVGHFDGLNWTEEEWQIEFSEFNKVLNKVQSDLNISSTSRDYLDPKSIKGFRAPELGVSTGLYKTLKDNSYTYDASDVNGYDTWPQKDEQGIWHFPLGEIYLADNKVSTIAMDYSIWQTQTQGQDILEKGGYSWQENYNELLNSYLQYFNDNYQNNRGPVIIGHHFSKWNDGLYWEVMKSFASEVCGKPQVYCVTFSELVDYLDEFGTK